MTTTRSTIRLGIVDSDSGFLRVLAPGLEKAGWQRRVLASPVPPDALVGIGYRFAAEPAQDTSPEPVEVAHEAAVV